MNIHGFHRVPTCDMEDIVHLRKSQEVAVILLVAGTTSAINI